tara:strand:- start:620 stop:1609 length:990 start_codon:yes stop_codon:yes gene_type:complete
MKRENINYVVVGSFVLIVVACFFVFLYQITGSSGPTDKYFATYKNVTGIKFGTPVSFEGYQIGQVEEIIPIRQDGKTNYRLVLSIQEDWPVPQDSIAKIVASGLLAAVTIDIEEGVSNTLLEPESEIESQEAANLFAAVNEVAEDIRGISRDGIKPLLDNLNNQINSISSEFTDLTKNTVKPMVEKISTQIDKSDIVNKVDKLVSNLNQTSDNLKKVINNKNRENLASFLDSMSVISANTDELVGNLDETRKTMDAVLENVGDMVETNSNKLDSSLADLHKTLSVVSTHIDAITHHLEGSSRNMHEFTRQIKENPGLLIRGSAQTEEAK